MLSVDEEEEEEEDDEEEEEKKDEIKEVKNKKLIKEEKKVKEPEKDDINDGSFMTQPPVKLVNKLNNNNHTIKNDNKSKSENTNKNSNINDVKIDNINNKNINNNSINIIQKINPDKKSSIIVAIRVRPLNQTELKITSVEGIKILDSNSLIVTSDPSAPNKKTNLIKEHQFFLITYMALQPLKKLYIKGQLKNYYPILLMDLMRRYSHMGQQAQEKLIQCLEL